MELHELSKVPTPVFKMDSDDLIGALIITVIGFALSFLIIAGIYGAVILYTDPAYAEWSSFTLPFPKELEVVLRSIQFSLIVSGILSIVIFIVAYIILAMN